MELLNDPNISSTKRQRQRDSPSKSTTWRSQQDYKRQIITMEIQNQKYRNELYQLGETVNKILDKVKVSSSSSNNNNNNNNSSEKPTVLEQQLQLVKKQLHNVNQFIDIYQKELAVMSAKKKKDQGESIMSTEQVLQQKSQQLQQLRKQVKQLSHKNKALEYKLLQYSKKGKTKSADQQALQLRQLLNENKNLKNKLQELQTLHGRRQKWLESNLASAKQLQTKVTLQKERSMTTITKLPKIQSINKLSADKLQRSSSSLPKLQSQKKIYTKWLETVAKKGTSDVIDKELEQLEKINTLMQAKISNTSVQVRNIQQQIDKLKEKISQYDDHVVEGSNHNNFQEKKLLNGDNNNSKDPNIPSQSITPTTIKQLKKKHVGTMVTRRLRKMRKDWVGKFDGLRFSDNRYVREQSRLYKIIFNTNGYCQFFYYSCRDNKQRFNSKLPFDASNLLNPGKDSSFTVEYPDFVKNIRLKINLKTHKVTGLAVVSNLGIESEFMVDSNAGLGTKTEKKTIPTGLKQEQQQSQVSYQMDVKTNQAIICIFGSYGYKLDEKKQITNVWLEGLGVEIIEDFVQELI